MKLSILYAIIFIGGLFMFGYLHEDIHQTIWEDNRIESSVQWFENFPDITTTATFKEGECDETCELAHQLNEVVAYPLMVFYLLIGSGLFFIIILLEAKWE